GQYYILIDPSANATTLDERFDRIIEGISGDPDVRIPGMTRRTMDVVEVGEALWRSILQLASATES
ncbi:MAG: Ldh family oxidoreductase, partial [Boseongicola sp.]